MNGIKHAVGNRYYWANPAPLGNGAILIFHGGMSSAQAIQRASQMDRVADKYNFTTIYPEGTQVPGGGCIWNAGTCCGRAIDLGYVNDVLDDAINRYGVDPSKILLTGFSLGSCLCHYLATKIPQRIKAIAGVSSGMILDPFPKNQQSVPVMMFHGAKDGHALIGGGQTGQVEHNPIRDSVDYWVKWNECFLKPMLETRPDYIRETYGGGKAPVIYYELPEGGHQWPGGLDNGLEGETLIKSVNASEIILSWFNSL